MFQTAKKNKQNNSKNYVNYLRNLCDNQIRTLYDYILKLQHNFKLFPNTHTRNSEALKEFFSFVDV